MKVSLREHKSEAELLHLEYSTMFAEHVLASCPDINEGTMFNVISCDSFTMQDGKLKMSRTDCQRSVQPAAL